jgi:CheY-like chemotaxis protein
VCAQLLREDGWEVVEAEDGATGSAAFAREPDRFAVVLLDMEMPVLRGDECLRRIRAVRPGVPALLISGFVGDVDGPEGPLAGFDGLVRKPFRLAELQEVLDGLRARR